ncbi:FAD-dependent oxidoreductase [Chitinophaga lutea]
MNTRDGRCVSLWQQSQEVYQPRQMNRQDRYDVIIAGGGITGLSTALRLQEEGKRCLLLEAREIGFGTTGGTTAHINTLLDTPYSLIAKNFGEENAAMVAKAASGAVAQIRENIGKYDIRCGFSTAAAYLFAQDEEQEKELDKITEATSKAGIPVTDTDHIPIPIPFRRAIRVPGQAQFHPLEYLFALAKTFEHLGGAILQECPVTAADVVKEGVEVETERGVFKAGCLIYATHIPPGVNLLHLRCTPYRSYAVAAELADNAYPEDLCYDMEDPYHYFRTQEVEGRRYLIAGGKDHRTGEEANTAARFLQLESEVSKHFKVRQFSFRWSSQYYEPADGLPYIGRLPGFSDNVYVATGFGGNGMTYSAVAAKLLTDLIVKGESPYEQLFDPNRIKPVAGFTNFIKHNAEVVRLFAGKLFSGEALPELADLAPGEARLVLLDGEKLAVYKDDNGQVHAIRPVCTHLGCEVAWNAAELSWDCPCHGARYDADGLVLNGPADISLEKVHIRADELFGA